MVVAKQPCVNSNSHALRWGRCGVAGRWITAVLLIWTATASAQQPPIHYFQSTRLVPGAVAQGQLARGLPLSGYIQPVEVRVPRGAHVAISAQGEYDVIERDQLKVGLQIGPVYQLKVTNIPNNEGSEVFPTIELLNRLYPPPGHATRFPIPIHLTQQELEWAIAGRFVTRVIYLEDSQTALPRRDDPDDQRYFEVPPSENPLKVADRLGRPMAILRMGSRVPMPDEHAAMWPPVTVYPDEPEPAQSAVPNGTAGNSGMRIERRPASIPRISLSDQSGHSSRATVPTRR